MANRTGSRQSRYNRVSLRATALGLVSALAIASCGDDKKPSDTPPVRTNTTAKLAPEVSQQVKNMDEQGKAAARNILAILRDPKSGAEAYNGTIVSNKGAIVGPDLKMYTEDDKAYSGLPETTGRYYPETGKIYLRATGENPAGPPNDLTGGSPLADSLVILKVGANNPIKKEQGQITANDLSEAVDYPGAKVVAVSGSYDKGYSERTAESADGSAYVTKSGKVYTDLFDFEDLALGINRTGGVQYGEAPLTAPAEQAEAISEATQALGQASYLLSNQAFQRLLG